MGGECYSLVVRHVGFLNCLDTIGKRKKRRKNREPARRRASDDASSSNDATDASTQNVKLTAETGDECDSGKKADVTAEVRSKTEKHSQTSVASDKTMLSESVETMEADSYPPENKIPSSVSMHSLSPES